MLFRRSSKGLRDIGCERPHAALMRLHDVIAASIEADGLIVHVQPPAPQFPVPVLVGRAVESPSSSSIHTRPPESKRVIQVPGHVLNVPVQAHAGIEEHGDGRPGAARKAAAEKAVDGSLPQAGCIGDPDHTARARRAPALRTARRPQAPPPGCAPVLPVRRPQVQQSHEVGFAGLLRGVPARRFHAFLKCGWDLCFAPADV